MWEIAFAIEICWILLVGKLLHLADWIFFWGKKIMIYSEIQHETIQKHCKSWDPWLHWKVVRALLRPRAGLCCSAGWGSVLLGIVLKENTEKTWNRYFWHIVSKPLCGCILGPVWNGLWHFLAVWWSWNHEFAVCIHYQNVWAANCTINQGKRRLIECLCFFWNWNLITSAPPCLTTCKFQQQLHWHSSNVLNQIYTLRARHSRLHAGHGNIPSSQTFGSYIYILNHPKTKNRPPLLGMVLWQKFCVSSRDAEQFHRNMRISPKVGMQNGTFKRLK